MIGLKKFFKYFWNYFRSKGCAIKWVIIVVWALAAPFGILFVCTSSHLDGASVWTRILDFLGFMVLVLIPVIPIIGIVLGRRLAKFRLEVGRLSYNDLKNKKEYYRDFLENYSPAVLSYIDDFNVREEDIVATVLNLELKEKIKVEQDKIKIISHDETSLDYNERYVLNAIKNKSFNLKLMMEEFASCTQRDVNKYGLLCEKKAKRRGIILSLIKWTLLFFGAFLGIAWIYEGVSQLFDFNEKIFEIILGVVLGVPMLFVLVIYPETAISYCFFSYIQTFREKRLYRTDKAEKINENMEGLKNFLKDFSLLNEKEKKDIELWDRYLIYSVMFGQNKEIVKDFEKYCTSKGEKND